MSVRQCIDCQAEGLGSTRKAPHVGPRCATHHRAKRVTRRSMTAEQRWRQVYGISADEYWSIYQYQGGRCFICERATGKTKRLSVDHCHTTGIVRGLLCTMCNSRVLGHLRDDLDAFERAIDYLTSPPATRVIGLRVVPNFDH